MSDVDEAVAMNISFKDATAVHYGIGLLAQVDNVSYVQCNVQEIELYFDKLSLNPDKEIVIGLDFLPFYQLLDALQILVQKLDELLPSGSKIFQLLFSTQIGQVTSDYFGFQLMFKQCDINLKFYPIEQMKRIMLLWSVAHYEAIIDYLYVHLDDFPAVYLRKN